MTIKQLSIEQFTAFEQASFEFSPGINVFIGTNSTGKTHVMKLIYSLLKVCEWGHRDSVDSNEKVGQKLSEKLQGVFKPEGVNRLVRQNELENTNSQIHLIYDDFELDVSISLEDKVSVKYGRLANTSSKQFSSLTGVPPQQSEQFFSVQSLYIPPNEFISTSKGFVFAYNNRETSFDETYYDLSVALDAALLRGSRLAKMREVIKPLEEIIDGRVINEHGRFYIQFASEEKIEIHLISEGFRKIAELIYLINNGSLSPNSILFWDEPEANMNPRIIPLIVKLLKVLAAHGVQIFAATHDYLFSQELSLLVEYPSDTNIRFFSFHKPNQQSNVTIESGETLVDIEHNPILSEYAAHYEREVKLFQSI